MIEGHLFNFRPKVVNEPGTPDGIEYLLCQAEWLDIQGYVNYAKQLPTSHNDLRNLFAPQVPSNLNQYNDMTDRFGKIKVTCKKWEDETYPGMVAVTDGVIDFARKAGPQLRDLRRAFEALKKDRGNEALIREVNLKAFPIHNQIKELVFPAERLYREVDDFREESKKHQEALGPLEFKYKRLHSEAEEKHRETLGEIEAIKKDIEALADEIYKAELAKSKVTRVVRIQRVLPGGMGVFVWVPAAIYDHAVYGPKMKAKDEELRIANNKLEAIQDQEKEGVATLACLDSSINMVKNTEKLIGKALPSIARLEGYWKNYSGDLDNFLNYHLPHLSTQDINHMEDIIDDAIIEWKELEKEAKRFREVAYCQF